MICCLQATLEFGDREWGGGAIRQVDTVDALCIRLRAVDGAQADRTRIIIMMHAALPLCSGWCSLRTTVVLAVPSFH